MCKSHATCHALFCYVDVSIQGRVQKTPELEPVSDADISRVGIGVSVTDVRPVQHPLARSDIGYVRPGPTHADMRMRTRSALIIVPKPAARRSPKTKLIGINYGSAPRRHISTSARSILSTERLGTHWSTRVVTDAEMCNS